MPETLQGAEPCVGLSMLALQPLSPSLFVGVAACARRAAHCPPKSSRGPGRQQGNARREQGRVAPER